MLLTILLFCFYYQVEESNISSGNYTSKTYRYFGNSFETRHDSKIDTLEYTWADSFFNGILIKRYHPSYQQDFVRTEKYQYDSISRLVLLVTETVSKHSAYTMIDSFIYNYQSDSAYTLTKSTSDIGKFIEIWTTIGDTTFMEQIMNGVSAFTSREYLDSLNRKHRQIIKPEMSNVENIEIFNDRGDEIQTISIEDGITEISTTTDLVYDDLGRIIDKTVYWGNRKDIMYREITLYR